MVAKDVHWMIKGFSHPNYETDSGIFTDKGKKPQEDKKLKIYESKDKQQFWNKIQEHISQLWYEVHISYYHWHYGILLY